MDELARRSSGAITPRTRVILICHVTNLTGQIFPVRADLPHGPRARDRGDRGRRARVRALPVQARRPRLRLLRRRACTSGSSRRTGRASSTCGATKIKRLWPLMAGGREAGRRHPQVRGDRHAPRGEPPRDRRGARLPPRHRRRAQGRPPALPARSLDAAALEGQPRVRAPHELRPGDVVRDRQRAGRGRRLAQARRRTCSTRAGSSSCRSSTRSSRACA